MALKIAWAQPALDDFDDILSFIAMDKPAAAKTLYSRAMRAIEKLIAHPRLGRAVPELSKGPYRELLVAPVRIIYRQDKQTIFIVHVVRQERPLTLSRLK